MLPAAEPLALPEATPLPYAAASADQHAQALAFLRQQLAAHFPHLAEAAWQQALDRHQPELWLLADGRVELDWQDVTQLTQRLAAVPGQPTLDPPIHSHYTHYLARRLHGFGQWAVQALAELEAHPHGAGPQTVALVAALTTGNGPAEQVLRAFSAGGRPVAADEQPGSLAVADRLRALAQLRRGS